MKLSERMRRFVGSPGAVAEDWAAEVAALEEQLLERQAECFVLSGESASARRCGEFWKAEGDAYKALMESRERERDSARRVARALFAVYRFYRGHACSMEICDFPDCEVIHAARRALAQAARHD